MNLVLLCPLEGPGYQVLSVQQLPTTQMFDFHKEQFKV